MKTNTLSMLVHAWAKVGKTTLGSTAPAPILVLDAEGGWRFIRSFGRGGKPAVVVHWNPMNEPTPRRTPENPIDIVIVTVRDWTVLSRVYTMLTQAMHDFQSVIVDSITEIQRRCKQSLVGSEDMQRENWGRLLVLMDNMIRSYRDLVLIDTIPTRFVLFIAETRVKPNSPRQVPTMQGQIEGSLPYWVDACGYLFVEEALDPTDPEMKRTITLRRMLIGTHPMYEAGNRLAGILPDIIDSPNISQMFCQIYGDECTEGVSA